MNVFTIYLGDEKPMNLKVVSKDCGNIDPYDLTGAEEIDVALPNQDGTLEHFLLSDGDVVVQNPEVLGRFTVNIDAERSALLAVGVLQTFTATITNGSNVQTVTYAEALSVLSRT